MDSLIEDKIRTTLKKLNEDDKLMIDIDLSHGWDV
jgi:hypothetical protein